jgi:hypothetical protein
MADGQQQEPEFGNLSIKDIDRGFLVEQIDEHLKMAYADVLDLNKEATKKRTVNIQIVIMPEKSRRAAQVDWNVDLKPSSHIKRESQTIFLGKDKNGNAIATAFDPKQPVLFDSDEPVRDAVEISNEENN